MKTLIVKSIYIPAIDQIEINKKSIESFLTLGIDMILIGWIHNYYIEEFKEYLISKDLNHIIWPENRGKTYLLKNIPQLECFDKYQNFLYADHDICLDKFYIDDRLMGCYYQKKKIGVITYNQSGDNRHNSIVYKNKQEILGKTYYICDNQCLIASGCFLVNKESAGLMTELYSTHIYGDEDVLLGKLWNKHKIMNIISSSTVHHPLNKDDRKQKITKLLGWDILSDKKNV